MLRIALLEISEEPLLGEQLLRGFVDTAELAVEDLYLESEHLTPDDVAHASARATRRVPPRHRA